MPVYKDEKRNTWYFRTYIEDYDGTIKQKSRSGFATKKVAKEEEQKLIDKYNSNFKDITFQELYDDYLKYKSQTLKANSIKAMRDKCELHILPFFKNYKLSKITHKTYIEWKEKIIAKNYSYKYNTNLHGYMVNILNYAIDFYDLEKNIAQKVGNFSRNNYCPKVSFWTQQEFNSFIKEVDNFVYQAFFWLLYYTGMRRGEALALTWHDIESDYINITKTLSPRKIEEHYIVNSPKTFSSRRKIKIDKTTINILQKLKKYYLKYVGFSEEWYVFGGVKPLASTTIERKKNEYCKIANVKQIKIHDFRHSHASLLLSNNVPITVISKRLGHSDINMTLNVYSHLFPEDENKAVNLLEKLNSKKTIIRENQENVIKKNSELPIKRELQA